MCYPNPQTMGQRGLRHSLRTKAQALSDMLKADPSLLPLPEQAARLARISRALVTTNKSLVSLG